MSFIASLRGVLFHQSKILHKSTLLRNKCYYISKSYSTVNAVTEGELRIANTLKEHLKVHEVYVQDISGGCGNMYQVFVSSPDFKGKRMLQQHRLVTEILKDEVKEMHGLRIETQIVDENDKNAT